MLLPELRRKKRGRSDKEPFAEGSAEHGLSEDLALAVEKYRRVSASPHPSWSEIVWVLLQLGWSHGEVRGGPGAAGAGEGGAEQAGAAPPE